MGDGGFLSLYACKLCATGAWGQNPFLGKRTQCMVLIREPSPSWREKRRACGHDAPKRGNQPGLLFQGRSNLASGDGTRYITENEGVALALRVACVGDFPWISFETGNPSGTDPAPKVKGWP